LDDYIYFKIIFRFVDEFLFFLKRNNDCLISLEDSQKYHPLFDFVFK